MKRLIGVLGLGWALGISAVAEVPVIPRPTMVVEEGSGVWQIADGATVRIGEFPGSEVILERLSQATGKKLKAIKNGEAADIVFALGKPSVEDGPSGYSLQISEKGALLSAGTQEGLFYAAESLGQIVQATPRGKIRSVPAVTIRDRPRFAWRGYMLDESRHFSGEAAVKRLLDAMARYKLNRLHWHLTDSSGWRIEIKKYPKLTSIGGRGNETDRSDNAPVQFYTQEQIKRIVAYAAARHITVIPEIDMPGHADAAVLAYPEHDGGGMIQKGNPKKWPNFTFNPAKPETLAFLDDILKEVAALFPNAGMIHFGGDEVNFGWKKWPELPEVQTLMKKENLKDLPAIETWFNRRMAGTINGLGLKTGGWDEIAERGLPKDKTVVFWWRHDKPGILRKALDDGYPVVLCPRRPLYFDFLQDPTHKTGRNWGGINPLADVYEFPAGLKLSEKDETQVLGLQACLWTETCLTQARRDFLTWPRLVAVAESGWTAASRKDFASFEARLKPQIGWLVANGIATWDPFGKPPEVSDQGAAVEYPDKPE
ncbi:MAG: beta-hexosaminidase [Verrucomicrobiales bacterium VVV1]|nr:MAG: beta-hexosaminidase [Verrucomicrobiales bacterium VVV1]